MERAALYIRVSSEEQAIHGLSIEAQREKLDQWAKGRVKIVDHYVDAGISARKPATKRPELQRLLNDVRAGLVDVILFTKLDRWFRNIAEYYKVQEVLEKHHVNWRTIQEDYDTSTASGRLKINIMLSVAQDEADRTGERIKAVFESKLMRNEPISGKVPLGYKIENKRLVIEPEKADIVRDIFRYYISTRSIRETRKYILNRWGISYCHTSIRSMLQNERYIGRAHDSDTFCPSIVPKDDFLLANKILSTRAERYVQSRSNRVYLFTGLVFCAECGNRLSAHVVGQKYIYYRCTRYEKTHICSHKKRTSELVLEDWLVKNLLAQFAAYNVSISADEKPDTKIDTSKIRRKMEKLKDLYLNDLIERDVYERDYSALKESLLEAERVKPKKKPVDLSAVADALKMYDGLSRTGKKEFWSRTVSKIVITNEDDFFVYPTSP